MNWRTIGNVTVYKWQEILTAANSPMANSKTFLTTVPEYIAAGEHTALCLAMLYVESKFGTAFNANIEVNKNYLNLRPPAGNGYMSFSNAAEGIRAWRERITSLTYKNGIYANTTTLEELIHVYAPSSDGNNEVSYVASIKRLLIDWEVPPKEEMKMRLTPYPAIVERPLPDKFGAGMSWLPRWTPQGNATGSFSHSMVGWLWSTDAYFRLLSVRAATDYGIGGLGDGSNDGVIFRWINYFLRKNTAGWASGYDQQPDFDGRGREYVEKFGWGAVNGTARSIELSGLVKTPVSSKQWTSFIHLLAAIHHNELKQGHDEFEWALQHRDVAEKDCAFPRTYNFLQEYHAAVVLVMKHYELGVDIPDTVQIAGLTVSLPGGLNGGAVTPVPEKPIMIAFPQSIVFHTRPGAMSRQWASRESDVVREYPADTRLRMVGYYHGQEVSDDDRWLVIKSSGPSNNARMHVSGLKEKIVDLGAPKP